MKKKDYIKKASAKAAESFSKWEQWFISVIAKNIKKIGELSPEEAAALDTSAIASKNVKEAEKRLRVIYLASVKKSKNIFTEAVQMQKEELAPLFAYSNSPLSVGDKQAVRIVNEYAEMTAKNLKNLTNTKALRLVNADKKEVALRKAYVSALNEAVEAVEAQTADFQTALRKTVKNLGGHGVKVDYGGYSRRLDSSVRQSLLWGSKQSCLEYSDEIGQELGCDGFEVDFHFYPRKSHEFMGGRQFAYGKARTVDGKEYANGDEALARLNDYGCLHFKTPIFIGISEPVYSSEELKRLDNESKKPIEIDGKTLTGYEWKQRMRAIETETRQTNGEINALRAFGDKAEEVEKLEKKHAKLDTEYRRIANNSKLPLSYERIDETP